MIALPPEAIIYINAWRRGGVSGEPEYCEECARKPPHGWSVYAIASETDRTPIFDHDFTGPGMKLMAFTFAEEIAKAHNNQIRHV